MLFKTIEKEYKHNFQVSKTGLFCISISARCKSGEQTGIKGGEDLRVEIDDKKFREVPPKDKPQYKDIPSAWNGAKLKGLKKTVIFILRLNKGEHNLKFIPEQGANIEEEPKIKIVEDTSRIVFNLEEQAEDGDCRPWITFVLVDLPLESLTAEVTVKWRLGDSDDIKLIIDNNIQKNKFSIFHRYWLWSGSIFNKLLQRETQTKIIKIEPKADLHYIEFWADKTPVLHRVELVISPPQGKVVLYKDLVSGVDTANLRTEPSTESEIVIEIPEGEKVIILEKGVEGEALFNEYLTDLWHKVSYNEKIGHILSSLIELDGLSRENIAKKIQEASQEFKLSKEVLLKLAYCESKLLPYVHSEADAKGIFQLMPDTVDYINNYLDGSISDPFDVDQNINGGMRYFQYLQKKYQDADDALRKTIVAWSRGPDRVPKDQPIDEVKLPAGTQILLDCFYKAEKPDWLKNFFVIFLISFLSFCSYFAFHFAYRSNIPIVKGGIEENIEINKIETVNQKIKYPNVILNDEKTELIFIETKGGAVANFSIDRLNFGKIFNIPSEEDGANDYSIRIRDNVIERPKNIFYFLVASSYTCGAQNCTWALYKFDASKNELMNVNNDVSGAAPTMHLSPDGLKMAIVTHFHASACYNNGFIDIIDLYTFKRKVVKGFEDKEYPVSYIKSLKWLSDSAIMFSTTQGDCSQLGEGSWERDFNYDVNLERIDLVEQKFKHESS